MTYLRGPSSTLHRAVEITSRAGCDEQARSEVELLQLKLQQHELIIQTLVAMLLEKEVMTAEEFQALADGIDGLDGRRDGRLADETNPVVCPKCRKNNARTKPACMWCGADLTGLSSLIRKRT
jgi:hypothetical protein